MPVDFEDAYASSVDSVQIGAVLVTPAAALDKMEQINASAIQLDAMIQAKARPEFKASWDTYYTSWKKFYADNGPGFSGWTSRLWGSTYEAALEHEKKIAQWYAGAQKENIVTNNPAAPQEEKEFPWKWVLIGGGLLLGYVLVKEVGKGVGSAVSTVTKKVAE